MLPSFNEGVNNYNKHVLSIPKFILAGLLFNFDGNESLRSGCRFGKERY
jgi:hypothetical protein